MQIKDEYRLDDVRTARSLVRAHPFATIVSADLRATHMPCLVEEAADGLVLLGHVARADPVSRSLAGPLLLIFHGPHGYVSGSWLVAESWHAEAKLWQDKPEDEQARVLAGFEAPGPYANAPLARAMRRAGAGAPRE